MNKPIDFEKDADEKVVSDEQLHQIALLAEMQRNLEEAIKAQQEMLDELTKQHRRVSELDLPSAMAAAGMLEFKLADGTKVTVKPETYASVPKARQFDAYRWLDEHGVGDIIKSKVEVAFGRDRREDVKKLLAVIEGAGFDNYSTKESIHPQTLNAFVREQLEAGVNLPPELFTVHKVNRAVV